MTTSSLQHSQYHQQSGNSTSNNNAEMIPAYSGFPSAYPLDTLQYSEQNGNSSTNNINDTNAAGGDLDEFDARFWQSRGDNGGNNKEL